MLYSYYNASACFSLGVLVVDFCLLQAGETLLVDHEQFGRILMKKLQSVALALCCLALVILICGANATYAQEVTATITGTVTDPSGAAVAGAAVTAKSVERGITYTATTNDSGSIVLPSYQLGATTFASRRPGSRPPYIHLYLSAEPNRTN